MLSPSTVIRCVSRFGAHAATTTRHHVGRLPQLVIGAGPAPLPRPVTRQGSCWRLCFDHNTFKPSWLLAHTGGVRRVMVIGCTFGAASVLSSALRAALDLGRLDFDFGWCTRVMAVASLAAGSARHVCPLQQRQPGRIISPTSYSDFGA